MSRSSATEMQTTEYRILTPNIGATLRASHTDSRSSKIQPSEHLTSNIGASLVYMYRNTDIHIHILPTHNEIIFLSPLTLSIHKDELNIIHTNKITHPSIHSIHFYFTSYSTILLLLFLLLFSFFSTFSSPPSLFLLPRRTQLKTVRMITKRVTARPCIQGRYPRGGGGEEWVTTTTTRTNERSDLTNKQTKVRQRGCRCETTVPEQTTATPPPL